MVIASIAEMFSIATVIPFLGVIAAPETVFNLEIFQGLIQFLSLTSPQQIVLTKNNNRNIYTKQQ